MVHRLNQALPLSKTIWGIKAARGICNRGCRTQRGSNRVPHMSCRLLLLRRPNRRQENSDESGKGTGEASQAQASDSSSSLWIEARNNLFSLPAASLFARNLFDPYFNGKRCETRQCQRRDRQRTSLSFLPAGITFHVAKLHLKRAALVHTRTKGNTGHSLA